LFNLLLELSNLIVPLFNLLLEVNNSIVPLFNLLLEVNNSIVPGAFSRSSRSPCGRPGEITLGTCRSHLSPRLG